MSNTDSGNFKYTNPNGRLLTSNGAGWVSDGRDPILTLSSAGNGGATTVGYSVVIGQLENYIFGQQVLRHQVQLHTCNKHQL